MKITRKIVAFFILGLLLLPIASKVLQASEESNTVNVDITYVFDGENPNIEADANGLAYGSTLQLTPSNHAGYTWAYWIVNGVVRTDLPQNHTFRVSSNLTLQGIYAPVGKHTVVFLDANGQLIESQFVDDQGVATLPNVDSKSKPGLQVSASTPWRTSTGSVFNVATPITANTVVILQYETTVANTYLMTVNGIEEGPYNFNQLVSVEADAVDVSLNPFSHWEENGIVVSRSLSYVFTAVQNRTLTAVYQETPEADTPLVVLTRDIEQRSGYHTYVGQFYLPEAGYELVEYGFLIDEVNTLDLTKDNADYVVPVANYTEASNEFVMSFPIGSHLNVRAYFTYKVGTSVLTVYSDENPRYLSQLDYSFDFGLDQSSSYLDTDFNVVNSIDDSVFMVNRKRVSINDELNTPGSSTNRSLVLSPRTGDNDGISFVNLNFENEISKIEFEMFYWNSTAPGLFTTIVLQYFDGESWIDVHDIKNDLNGSLTRVSFTIDLPSTTNVRFYATGGQSNSNNARVLLDNVKVSSVYTGPTYNALFNVDLSQDTEIVKDGSPLSQPSNPNKTGYTFDGWYLEDTFITLYNFSTPVTSDLTLFAKFTINEYTISFDSNGGTSVSNIIDDYNAIVLEPTSPTKDGYLFDDWYIDAELTTPYVFDTMPANNITLYAGWILDTYDISYVLDSGVNSLNNPSTYTIETATISLEPATKDGYTFGGWYDNSEFTGGAVTEITLGSFGDITLYAKFTENTGTTYNVSIYDYLGGTLLDTQVVAENGFAVQPSDPTRTGYRFDTWYIDGSNTVYNWATPVVEPITIYGVWVQTFTVSFESNGGSAVSSQTIDINGYATEPVTNPTREGYTFDGWYNEALTVAFDFEGTPITSNTTVYAKWTLETQSPETFTETFSTDIGDSYTDGSFTGINGGTWSYVHSRNVDAYPIDGTGIMLRYGNSSLSTSLPDGVQSFSIDIRKAFTGTSVRQIIVTFTDSNNNVKSYTSVTFGTISGADSTIYNISANDVNMSGVIDVVIKLNYTGTTNKQTVVDNFIWTTNP